MPCVGSTTPFGLQTGVSDLLGRIRTRLAAIAADRKRRDILAKIGTVYPLEEVDTCLCGETEFERIATKDRHGIATGVSLCKACGLGVLTPRLTEEALVRFYESDYRTLYRGSDHIEDSYFERSYRRGERLIAFLAERGIMVRGGVAVEIGCGPGGILKALQDAGNEVWGCEYDRECAAFAMARGVKTLLGGIEVLIEAGVAADLVVLSHLFEHVPHPYAFLRDLRRVLRSGGMLYVEVPGLHNPNNHFFKSVQVVHLYYFDLETLCFVMARGGFALTWGDEIVRSIFRPGQPANPPPPEGNFERNRAVIEQWARMRP